MLGWHRLKQLKLNNVGVILLAAIAIPLGFQSYDELKSAPSSQAETSNSASSLTLNLTALQVQTINDKLKCNINTKSNEFRIGQLSAGNSLEGYLAVDACLVESDFMMTADGVIVSSHDPSAGGQCGMVVDKTMAQLHNCTIHNGQHLATLEDFLSIPLSEWYIDLKATQSGIDDQSSRQAITNTIEQIIKYDRQAGAVLMVYTMPEDLLRFALDKGIRLGLKGYPEDSQQVVDMIYQASAGGYEMICVKVSLLDQGILELSTQQSVWHLAWDDHIVGKEQWHQLRQQGLSGLISVHPGLLRQAYH